MKKSILHLNRKTQPRKKENERRGMNHRKAAIEFIRKFPIGTVLTWDTFSRWAYAEDQLKEAPPGPDTDKQSTEWLAYLQRRHQIRANINKAGAHTAMAAHGGAFIIDVFDVKEGTLKVRSVIKALAESNAAKKVESLAKTKRRQLEYLIQSADWNVLPPHERMFAEALYDDMDYFVSQIEGSVDHLDNKFTKLQNRIETLVKNGSIESTNGGIKALLSHDDD